jgi:LPPG:FO 2-phospho-L-lactate transferase
MILVLAGGVGGAKLANGLARILPPEDVLVAVNTGDDFVHLGLRISPDLDTVMYTLAGMNNPETGWGIAGETWNAMAMLERLGEEAWFRLGDRDLATHIARTERLREGQTLSEVTAAFCSVWGVRQRVVPMTDHAVATVLHTDEGLLSFQHYFVRRRCEPRVNKIDFVGAANAPPSPAFAAALADPRLRAVVFCPSNPYLSIQPILSLAGVRHALENLSAPVVAVSPLIGGAAVKGPAAKIMRELGNTPSTAEIARFYLNLVDGLVIDDRDRDLGPCIAAMGLRVSVSDTLMNNVADQMRLAGTILDFISSIATSAPANTSLNSCSPPSSPVVSTPTSRGPR